jgi:hypothetical protein
MVDLYLPFTYVWHCMKYVSVIPSEKLPNKHIVLIRSHLADTVHFVG